MTTELPGIIIVALTLYFEGAFEPIEGKIAVANVIRNRVEMKKTTYAKECLKPKQFSCWNGKKKQEILELYNTSQLFPKRWEECKMVANALFDGSLKKQSFTHYYNPKLCAPSWAIKLCDATRIGKHIFGKLK